MADETILKYLDTKKAYDKQREKIRAIGSIIAPVSHALINEPYDLRISSITIPLPISTNPKYSLKADDWPSIETIAKELCELHKLKNEVEKLWTTIPENDQGNLSQPWLR